MGVMPEVRPVGAGGDGISLSGYVAPTGDTVRRPTTTATIGEVSLRNWSGFNDVPWIPTGYVQCGGVRTRGNLRCGSIVKEDVGFCEPHLGQKPKVVEAVSVVSEG